MRDTEILDIKNLKINNITKAAVDENSLKMELAKQVRGEEKKEEGEEKKGVEEEEKRREEEERRRQEEERRKEERAKEEKKREEEERKKLEEKKREEQKKEEQKKREEQKKKEEEKKEEEERKKLEEEKRKEEEKKKEMKAKPSPESSSGGGESGKASPVKLQALYNFKAKNKDEISFSKGDILILKSKGRSQGWLFGHLEKDPSLSGFFPGNYIKKL